MIINLKNLTTLVGVLIFSFGCQPKKEEKSDKMKVEEIGAARLTGEASNCKVIYICDTFPMHPNSTDTSAHEHFDTYECRKSWDIVDQVFQQPNPFRSDSLDSRVLSTALHQLIIQSKETEKQSREQIRKSKYPTDKPLLIEGEVFTSLYEGYTGFKSREEGYFSKKGGKLTYDFENSNYHQKWTDTILLILENKTWKLDNVVYGKKTQHKSLKETLENFIQAGKEEQKQMQKK
ncbi:MAG: hypothetical protein ACK54Y_09795 [Bacteroidota bacterium]|jgi:hypothetical protein